MGYRRTGTKLFYKIGEVCELAGIRPHVLRYWESEFPALKPRKNRGGQRVYQPKDLELVFRIKRMLHEEGYTIAGARKKLRGPGEVADEAAGEIGTAGAGEGAGDAGPDMTGPAGTEESVPHGPGQAEMNYQDAGMGGGDTGPVTKPAELQIDSDALKKLKKDVKDLLDILS